MQHAFALPPSDARSDAHALVPFDAADQDLRDLLQDVVEPVKEPNPYRSWMTGKLPTSERHLPVGWHVHKGVNPRLDALLERLGYQHHQIEHASETGENELVDYWALNSRRSGPQGPYELVPCSLFVVARGVKDKREMKRPEDRDGVAYGWEVQRHNDGSLVLKADGTPKKTARLKFRAYIHELLPPEEQWWDASGGFPAWFQASVSGYLVDDMLAVLYAQYRAMRAYNQRAGTITPYWALSNPTVPASTPRRVTSKENGQSTTIVGMRSLIPSQERDISEAFLQAHRMPDLLQQEILKEDVLLEAWQWSKEESAYLEGIKPRPGAGGAPSPDAAALTGVVVREERPEA